MRYKSDESRLIWLLLLSILWEISIMTIYDASTPTIQSIITLIITTILILMLIITPLIIRTFGVKYIGAFENNTSYDLLGFYAMSEKGINRKIKKAKKQGWYYDGFGELSPLRKVDKFPTYLETIY